MKRDTLVLQVGGWAWGLQPHPGKESYVMKTWKLPRKGSTVRRRLGYKEKELIFGTWNVRTLFNTGALISLLSQLKQYKLDITALTRWEDVVQRDALQLLGMRRWRRRARNGDEWRHALRETRARKGL